MENEKLKSEFTRLHYAKEISLEIESYKVVTDAAFEIFNNQNEAESNYIDKDGSLLYQMTILKNLSILKLSEPINYMNEIDGSTINDTFDPILITNIVRAQYEAFCNFSNIYMFSNSNEERELKYYLWVLSGLNYRQRFKMEKKESLEKQKEEKNEIDNLLEMVKNNAVYLNLDMKSQKLINSCIERREWQIYFQGSRAFKAAWHQMMTNSGVGDKLDGQYAALSLTTHPSNVSVFQFRDLYTSGHHVNLTILALKLSKFFISFLISDYCKYFPSAKKTFDNLPGLHQLLINSYNNMFRGEPYTINEFGKDL